MKKIVFILIAILLLIIPTGCKKQMNYTPFISQLRHNVYFGKGKNIEVFIYLEEREKPFSADGAVGDKEKLVIIKVVNITPFSGEVVINFAFDKQYESKTEFSSLYDSEITTVSVKEFPKNNYFTITVIKDKQPENIQVNSLLSSSTKSYDNAINLIKQKNEEFFNKVDFSVTELNVRLITENGTNFWFVCFVNKNESNAFLIDDICQNIIAQKTFASNK